MLPWKRVIRPLAALLLAAVAVTAPAASDAQAAAAPSSGWNDFTCKPSAAHPRPVVLVHGTFGNSVDNWLGLAPYLTSRGYCVFSLDYGQLPGVRYTVIATRYDEVVTPYRSAFLTGPNVRNVVLQDLCAADLSEHLAIGLFDRIAFHEVANALDPDHARRTTCASVFS
ncbi:esterase/lipase family protein [Streptomyces pseudogriseolus]|uniref:esterase/lipase family protein n=1 Tax=Streptomyces pseudogriseolus TaxID=36817 RepID=UPI0036BEC77A